MLKEKYYSGKHTKTYTEVDILQNMRKRCGNTNTSFSN